MEPLTYGLHFAGHFAPLRQNDLVERFSVDVIDSYCTL